MEKLPHSRSCFVCGWKNPLGLQLAFETDGKTVQTRWIPRAEYNGFQNVVHGGVTATLLDEIMVWACGVTTGKFAYCAELNVRYNAPVRPGVPVLATGEFLEDRRGRLYLAKGEVRSEQGELLASATGKYIAVKDVDPATLLADFEAPPQELKRLFPSYY